VTAGGEDPFPARFTELAQQAEALADRITLAHRDLKSSDVEFIQGAGFRLDDAAGEARRVAGELRSTATDLARFAARQDAACQIPWGVCPTDGNTLTSTGGRTACRACGKSWDYDRVGTPCEEPARWILGDARGDSRRVCDGHARDARARLDGARLAPIEDSTAGAR
jgi:hypothetical protein